jgi:hypothetical protein
MKLLSVVTAKGARLAAKLPSGILVFSQSNELFTGNASSVPCTLRAAITAKGGLERLLPLLQSVADHPDASKFTVPEDSAKIAMPLFLPTMCSVSASITGITPRRATLPSRNSQSFSLSGPAQ